MKCPFCGGEMRRGALKGGAQTPPRWQYSGESAGLFGSGKVVRNFKRLGTTFEASGYLCERCAKAIIDVKI